MGSTITKMSSSPINTSSHSSTTFKVSNVHPKLVKKTHLKSDNKATKKSICSEFKEYTGNHCTEVLIETQLSSTVQISKKPGFVHTVIECYNEHHNLIIRPDDIWTEILMQFSFYVNKNAEVFRNQLVNFEEKKELVVEIDGMLRSAPYDIFVAKMTEKLDEILVDKTLKDWMLPNFTTTTTGDLISCGVIFMATMKKYFNFGCSLKCGIPYITLEGNVEDWKNILKRLEKLKTYKLKKWYDLLEPILKEFVAAKEGEVNENFWKCICNHLGGGSGLNLISGWLTVFAVFDVDGNWQDCGGEKWPRIIIEHCPNGYVCVDVKISDQDGNHECLMFAGHIANEVLEDGFTIKPKIGWCIALKLNSEELDKIHEAPRGKQQWACKVCNMWFNKDESSTNSEATSQVNLNE